jgi:hypothetical protein
MFMGFYLVCIWRSWLLLKSMRSSDDQWFTDAARMTIASLAGFMVAAQFVSLEALEIPYYVALLGAGSLAVHARMQQHAHQNTAVESALVDVGGPFESERYEPAPAAFHADTPMEVSALPMDRNSEPDLVPQRFFNSPREVPVVTSSLETTDWRDQVGSSFQVAEFDSQAQNSEPQYLIMN